ncbi:MAG: hypothetical protein ACPG7F_00835 [Aggregatilineales bacterium]
MSALQETNPQVMHERILAIHQMTPEVVQRSEKILARLKRHADKTGHKKLQHDISQLTVMNQLKDTVIQHHGVAMEYQHHVLDSARQQMETLLFEHEQLLAAIHDSDDSDPRIKALIGEITEQVQDIEQGLGKLQAMDVLVDDTRARLIEAGIQHVDDVTVHRVLDVVTGGSAALTNYQADCLRQFVQMLQKNF